MIHCQHAQNLFDAYLNEELTASLTAELDAHLLECALCRHRLSLLEACGHVIRLDTTEPGIAENFTDRITAILEQASRPGIASSRLLIPRNLRSIGSLVGIAALLGLAVVWYFRSPPPRPNLPDMVAAERVDVRQPSLAGSLIGGFWQLPTDRIVGGIENVWSVLELGQLTINRFDDWAQCHNTTPVENSSDVYFLSVPAATQAAPFIPLSKESESLPELDDEAESL